MQQRKVVRSAVGQLGRSFGALLLFLAASCAAHGAPGLNRFESAEPQMGAPFRIVLYAPDKPTADQAARAAFGRITQLNDILSDYDTDSELSRFSQTAGSGRAVPVSQDLWFVLKRSQELAQRTDGAFDVTVGPVVSLWRKARRENRLPSPAKFAEAMKADGYRNLLLYPQRHAARLTVAYKVLALGSIV